MRKHFAFGLQIILAMVLSGCAGAGSSISSLMNQPTAAPTPKQPPAQVVEGTMTTPHKIALLLPLKGSIAPTSQAIKNGFLAAYYQEREKGGGLDVKIIDTSGANVTQLYQQAIAAGADMVVGPLTKPEVEQLSDLGSLPVPTIALNTLENYRRHTVTNLYQFGLSPQDEAEQTADRMHAAGLKNVAVIAPAGSWGEKIVENFRDKFEANGGKVIATMNYGARDDLTADVCRLVTADPETMCVRHLTKEQKQKIHITRRPDVDSFFLVVNPRQARQIVPLLKFYYAGGLPAFATSSIYSGNPQPGLDQDINGVYFCDVPWVLGDNAGLNSEQIAVRNQLQTSGGDAFIGFTKLYALGVDAFNVATNLSELTAGSQNSLSGVTGKLYLDNSNHIYRQLVWARFQGGAPAVIH